MADIRRRIGGASRPAAGATAAAPAKRARRKLSAAARRRIAAAQKKRWAEFHKKRASEKK
jgi:hypothetical protein